MLHVLKHVNTSIYLENKYDRERKNNKTKNPNEVDYVAACGTRAVLGIVCV